MRRERDDLHPYQYNDNTWHTTACYMGWTTVRKCTCVSVATLNTQPTLSACLSALDALRDEIKAGKVVAFAAVGIETTDSVSFWCGATNPSIRRIKLLGAISQMNHDALDGKAFTDGSA